MRAASRGGGAEQRFRSGSGTAGRGARPAGPRGGASAPARPGECSPFPGCGRPRATGRRQEEEEEEKKKTEKGAGLPQGPRARCGQRGGGGCAAGAGG